MDFLRDPAEVLPWHCIFLTNHFTSYDFTNHNWTSEWATPCPPSMPLELSRTQGPSAVIKCEFSSLTPPAWLTRPRRSAGARALEARGASSTRHASGRLRRPIPAQLHGFWKDRWKLRPRQKAQVSAAVRRAPALLHPPAIKRKFILENCWHDLSKICFELCRFLALLKYYSGIGTIKAIKRKECRKLYDIWSITIFLTLFWLC